MARLNEPLQPATESVDALKRRFVRQNREIAKANSTQSLRIRSLEIEVSRLLAENVSLREQIIKLHYELEINAGKTESSTIESFKTRLDAKLKEVGNLVQELGDVTKAAKKRAHQKRKSMESKISPKRSPNQRLWKTTQTLSDLMSEAEGRLPPILEDKQFPRQTLDLEEIHGVLADPANLTDSPDLGPPPIAHFEEGEAITLESRDGSGIARAHSEVHVISHPPLPANLETRRRRRESIHSKDAAFEDFNNASVHNQSTIAQSSDNKSQAIKAGAKRKWNGREENDQISKEIESRREEVAKPLGDKASKSTSQKVTERPSSRADRLKEASRENSTATNSSTRKVLGPKSVNTDPQSPAKSKNPETKDKVPPTKESLAQRIRERDTRKERTRAKSSVDDNKPLAESVKPKRLDLLAPNEPETPAHPPLNLFSPTSTEPSARQESRGDTPPPPDLGPETATGSFGRASRRSRGSVSYAEPNLRDKMRRPTKELVDAVGAEERARQARAIKLDSVESALADIKLEDHAIPITTVDPTASIPNWRGIPLEETRDQRTRQKSESTSPLSQKTITQQQLQPQQPSDLPSSVTAERRRRTSTISRTTTPEIRESANSSTSKASSAGSTIAALAKPTTKRRQEGNAEFNPLEIAKDQTAHRPSSDAQRNNGGSIFDFTGSSPDAKQTSEKEDDLSSLSASLSRTSRSARRHSSVPALSDHGKGSLAISRRTRRESMV